MDNRGGLRPVILRAHTGDGDRYVKSEQSMCRSQDMTPTAETKGAKSPPWRHMRWNNLAHRGDRARVKVSIDRAHIGDEIRAINQYQSPFES